MDLGAQMGGLNPLESGPGCALGTVPGPIPYLIPWGAKPKALAGVGGMDPGVQLGLDLGGQPLGSGPGCAHGTIPKLNPYLKPEFPYM